MGAIRTAIRKLYRVADLAVVVYDGEQIIAVKHSRLSPWLVWHSKRLQWEEALREQASGFDLLPLAGHTQN